MKQKVIDLYKFASKDNTRPQMCGVYHDQEAQTAVVSDSHILVASKSHYQPERAGQIVAKDGTAIVRRDPKTGVTSEYKYPRWQSILPSKSDLKRDYTELDLNELRTAAENAKNFLANVPTAFSDGMKIKPKDARRRAILVLKFHYKDGDVGLLALDYTSIVKRLLMLPQEGARAYVRDGRRAIYWENESAGLMVIAMPVMIDAKTQGARAIQDGIFNAEEEEEKNDDLKGLYFGTSYISATVTDATRDLFSKKEKERIPMAKCLGEGNGRAAASVHLHPEAELSPVEGTKTFYKRAAENEWENPDLYKKDSGFFVYCGKLPPQKEVAMPVLLPNDTRTYLEMVMALGWHKQPSERVAYFLKRTGQTIPATA